MKSASQPAKQHFVPVVLITGAVLATVILMWLISKSDLASRSFDVSLFDTYFIVGWTFISLPIFLATTFILFFTRELILSHSNTGKLITLISGTLTFLFGSFLIGNHVRIDSAPTGWSALPPGIDPGDLRQLFSYNIKPAIVTSQIFLLFAMIVLAYRWGKARQGSKQ